MISMNPLLALANRGFIDIIIKWLPDAHPDQDTTQIELQPLVQHNAQGIQTEPHYDLPEESQVTTTFTDFFTTLNQSPNPVLPKYGLRYFYFTFISVISPEEDFSGMKTVLIKGRWLFFNFYFLQNSGRERLFVWCYSFLDPYLGGGFYLEDEQTQS